MGQAELFHVISTRHSILVASPDEAPCQASFLQLWRDFCTLTSDRGTQVCDGWYKIFPIVSVPKVLWEDAWFIFAFHFFCGCIVRVRSVCHVTGHRTDSLADESDGHAGNKESDGKLDSGFWDRCVCCRHHLYPENGTRSLGPPM